MTEVDFIDTGRTVSKFLVYDQKELYNYLRSWFADRHYSRLELDYSERIAANDKKIYSWRWRLEKTPEPLMYSVIELEFKAETEDVQIELQDGSIKKVQKGQVNVEMRSIIERDVKGDWKLRKETPYIRVIREIFEKVVQVRKLGALEKELKDDFNAVFKDLKLYLKMHRYD